MGARRNGTVSPSSLWLLILVAIAAAAWWTFFKSSSHGNRSSNSALSTSLRVFGPSPSETAALSHNAWWAEDSSLYTAYTPQQQRAFLQQYGRDCVSPQHQQPNHASVNIVLQRFDSLPNAHLQRVLWKYCMLYTGHGQLYVDLDQVSVLQHFDWKASPSNIAIVTEPNDPSAAPQTLLVHEALLYMAKPHSPVLQQMIHVLLETSNDALLQNDILLSQSFGTLLSEESDTWALWYNQCRQLVARSLSQLATTCPIPGGYCCHVASSKHYGQLPVLALRHPLLTRHVLPDDNIPMSGDPYLATIVPHVLPTTSSITIYDTPNFFDILLQNDCLPTQKTCHKCLKVHGTCDQCHDACPCYCRALCLIRPPPKQIAKEYHVYFPRGQKYPHRLIPKLIHQTWYEPVTPDKYPNMSRLMESWKTSGWEYTFYDDDTAATFLSLHFPPEVRQAYDAILPGAFKADLFRYCVLLIRGGIYADMDVLLESNLDEAIPDNVGFMTPMDEPGSKVGHRSCLWNGLLAVAPGHPFLAKTIELVVNNIRNRYTSVDYDDMLCPNPVLSVSHTVDTLFTCGPCILGAAINTVLGRHMQDEFVVGDIDLWAASSLDNPSHASSLSSTRDDPRWLVPGRSIILQQNKQDMGAHRFTWVERNLMVATTDMPDYDDRPPTKEHYSKTHEKVGVYGLKKLYTNQQKANEEIRIIVQAP